MRHTVKQKQIITAFLVGNITENDAIEKLEGTGLTFNDADEVLQEAFDEYERKEAKRLNSMVCEATDEDENSANINEHPFSGAVSAGDY